MGKMIGRGGGKKTLKDLSLPFEPGAGSSLRGKAKAQALPGKA
jgi:hypothetical protein